MESGRPLNVVKAELFKGLAHPVRIRILELLCAADEVSVGEMIEDTGLEASHVSQHLRVLRGYDLVTSQRRASQVYYRVVHPSIADMLASARTLLGDVLHHRQELAAEAVR